MNHILYVPSMDSVVIYDDEAKTAKPSDNEFNHAVVAMLMNQEDGTLRIADSEAKGTFAISLTFIPDEGVEDVG